MRLYDLVKQLMEDGITVDVRIEIRRSERPGEHTIRCQYCDWSASYSTKAASARALRAHHQHCTAYAQQMQWIAPAKTETLQDD